MYYYSTSMPGPGQPLSGLTRTWRQHCQTVSVTPVSARGLGRLSTASAAPASALSLDTLTRSASLRLTQAGDLAHSGSRWHRPEHEPQAEAATCSHDSESDYTGTGTTVYILLQAGHSVCNMPASASEHTITDASPFTYLVNISVSGCSGSQ